MSNDNLFICKIKSKKDGFEQEFEGSNHNLHDFEKMVIKAGYIIVFHKKK